MKSFKEFIKEDVQASVATVASPEQMAASEPLINITDNPPTAEEPDPKKKKKQKSFKEHINEWHPGNLPQKVYDRILPAVIVKGKLYTTRRGKSHGDITHPLGGKNVRWGYHDPLTKKFYDWDTAGLDSTDIMSPLQRIRTFGNEETIKEGYDAETMILKSRVIPAAKDQWGKVHLGKRGETHGYIWAGLAKKGLTSKKGYKGLEYGYSDPLTKKYYTRTALGFDATELPEFKKRWEETIHEELADYERQILKSRAIPALKHPVTGKIHIGKRGQDHIDLADSIFNKDKEGLKHYTELKHSGYIDSVTKKFYSRGEAGFDSSEIMSDVQRFRKYGSESFQTFGEFLNEASWNKMLYHATYNPEFKPHVGMHVGSLHAAMARAHQTSNDAGKNDYGNSLYIHAFRYNTKGKSSSIIDHTDESGSPTEMITHDPKDVGGYLYRKKIADTKEMQSHEDIGKALKSKGITHLSYRNTYEDPGSTSHMIYDPENLEKVHSFKNPKYTNRFKDQYKPYFDKSKESRKVKTEGFKTFGEFIESVAYPDQRLVPPKLDKTGYEVLTPSIVGKPVEVLKNPPERIVRRLLSKMQRAHERETPPGPFRGPQALRTLQDPEGNVYVWQAHHAAHHEVAHALNKRGMERRGSIIYPYQQIEE